MAKDIKREEVKGKLDKALENRPKEEPEEILDKDKPTVWTPFAKKLYTDIKLYKDKLGDAQPTRAVATKFRADIEEKLDDGKEKDSVIKYFNKEFRLPGVSTLPWNYFAESVIDPKAKENAEGALLKTIEKVLQEVDDELSEVPVKTVAKRIYTAIKNLDKKESILSDNVNEEEEKHYKYLKINGKVEKVECKDHKYAWSGKMPCTGLYRCVLCGKEGKENERN